MIITRCNSLNATLAVFVDWPGGAFKRHADNGLCIAEVSS